jgi:hypothetical protein
MKDGFLDVAICPSCATILSRQQIYEQVKNRKSFICGCGYEFNAFPYRPLTISEILRGRESEEACVDVNIEKYTRKVLEYAIQDNREGDNHNG